MIRKFEAATGTEIIKSTRVRDGWLSRLAAFPKQRPLGAAAGCIIGGMILIALLAPYIAPYAPAEQGFPRLSPPSFSHLLGTDELGRDMLSRIIFGSQISLFISIVAVGLAILAGTALGLISGYWSGSAVDHVIQRCVDALMAFPLMFMALGILALIGPGTLGAVMAIGIVMAPGLSRVVRGSVLSTRENVYVEAARAIGCQDLRILLRHILPNITAPIIILGAILMGNAILWEATISFLGLGTQPPNPSWGLMLSDARGWFEVAWWNSFPPGLAITLAVLGFNLLGDTLRDVLDPRLRQSRR